MSRPRLGVVLLIPGPVDIEVIALQRAVGGRPRVAPHITLVPPVNVRADRMDEALAVVRAAAGSARPMHLRIGPAATFWPVTPVLYLAVTGELDRLRRLRDAVFVEPLAHVLDHDFVPHVTVGESLGDVDLPALAAALDSYQQPITVEQVTVLEEGADRYWRPIADAPLGGGRIVGRGGLPVELATGQVLEADAAALFAAEGAGDHHGDGSAVVVTARREGVVVGAATARADDEMWLERLVGATRGCRRAFLLCPEGGSAQSWCTSHGWSVDLRLARWRRGCDFVRLARVLAA